MTLDFKISKPEKIGKITEIVYTFRNSDNAELSVYDLKISKMYYTVELKSNINMLIKLLSVWPTSG